MRRLHRLPSRRLVLVLVVAFALLATPPVAEAFPRTIVDDIGQEIYLDAPPQRIMSVGLAMDNILLAVTDPARVIGVTTLATDPQWSYVADRVAPHMTLVQQLHAEQVLALAPDIVLVAVWNDPDVVHQLRDLGVKLYTFASFDTVADALDNLARIGEITGDEERAQQLIDEFYRRYGQIAFRIAGVERPLVLSWDNWNATAGPGMSIHDIIELAGGVNVAALHGITGWHTLDAEAVIQMNPDVIVTPSGSEFAEQIKNDPVLQSVNAVRNGRVYYIEHMEALNHHFIEAIETLARTLHPEAFVD